MFRFDPSTGRWRDWVHGKGGSVPVPDPAVQTNAEAAANRYDINSPYGKQTWQQDDRQIIGYDSKGMPQYGQNYTQNIELNPSEQRQYDLHNQIAESLLSGAGSKISGFQDTPFDYGGSYQGPGDFSGAGGSYTGPGQFNNGQSQPFDYSAATPEVAKAQYQKTVNLLQPQFDRQNKDIEQRLANQGLPIGSEAYNEAYQQHEQNQNQALTNAALDATTQGNQLALQQRQQNVGEQAQTFGLNSDAGLATRQQQQGEAAQNFGLNANAGLQTRQQRNQEALTQRQQQYNELAAALGGQQLNALNGGGGGGASPLDVSGAYQAQNQANQTNAQLKNQGFNSILGGLSGLGSAYLLSDERLKEDVDLIDMLPNGEGVYEYSYKGDPERYTGVMAQEIEQTNPDAVMTLPSGVKAVDYRKVIAKALMEAA